MAFLVNLLLVFIVLKMLDNYFQGRGEREGVSSSSRERMSYQHCKGFLLRCLCKRDVFIANKKFSKQKMQHLLLVLLLLHLFVFPWRGNECIIITTQKKEFLFEDLKIQFKWLSLFLFLLGSIFVGKKANVLKQLLGMRDTTTWQDIKQGGLRNVRVLVPGICPRRPCCHRHLISCNSISK